MRPWQIPEQTPLSLILLLTIVRAASPSRNHKSDNTPASEGAAGPQMKHVISALSVMKGGHLLALYSFSRITADTDLHNFKAAPSA